MLEFPVGDMIRKYRGPLRKSTFLDSREFIFNKAFRGQISYSATGRDNDKKPENVIKVGKPSPNETPLLVRNAF